MQLLIFAGNRASSGKSNNSTRRVGSVLLTVFASILLALAMSTAEADESAVVSRLPEVKRTIGAVAMVKETESNLKFRARVDTGATTSSLHVEDWKIDGEADRMVDNVGKRIQFRIRNREGENQWLERRIVDISMIKTSEKQEQRYKVRMTLRCEDVEKRVLVSLNDRSHMNYRVLLGRNFLQGDFVVDVDLKCSGKKIEKSVTNKTPKTVAVSRRNSNG